MDIAGWENLYRSGERGSEDHPTRLLVETIDHLPPGDAVDLACGTGRNALYLASRGWTVTAVDAAPSAIQTLRERAAAQGQQIQTIIADLTDAAFRLPDSAFDLAVVAYYLQRDLYARLPSVVRPEGLILAIAHLPETGEPPSPKRVAPGELRTLFAGWQILHDYEGPSRDPAHRKPVAEIVATRPPGPQSTQPLLR